ncbi:PASTA domain-containing protein [Sediminibacterium ginsengisoli]|uniref:PASTA domain-containing protein n=1 Tax=Sediminibacterium ginsengisoli TaxID=413434 RepID=A0A1T4QRA7_9BACT|nr:PASTA domain-containing protein [Sediminibacterium ginsengisoli]SKA06292.1 PASTA domain-containing protein [Sediminibacterium ginsengisoli]
MFKFITEKPLWVNILAGVAVIFLLILLFFGLLGWFTGYGNYEKVPAVTGQNVVAAQKLLEDKGFDVVIQDSVFVDSVPKLAVTRQSPEADATVKSGRTIYLTINRMVPPQVEIPNFSGYSIKSAEMYLQSLGLKLGTVTYKPDIARNSVLEQLYNGAPLAPGTKVPLGSTISFVLGSGVGGSDIDVPDVIGMTLQEARSYLATVNVNIGSVVPVGAVRDSANAFVVKQTPAPLSEGVGPQGERVPNKIRQGQVMDLYISATPPARDTTLTPMSNN